MDIKTFTKKINNIVKFTKKDNISDDFYLHNFYFKKAILNKEEARLEKNYFATSLRQLIISKEASELFHPKFEISCGEIAFALKITQLTALKLMALGSYYKWWDVNFPLGISEDNESMSQETLTKIAENNGLHLFPYPAFENVMLNVDLEPLNKIITDTASFAGSRKLSDHFHIIDMTAWKVAINKTKADEVQKDAFDLLTTTFLPLAEANGIDFIRGWGIVHSLFKEILQNHTKAIYLMALGEYYGWWVLKIHPHTPRSLKSQESAERLIEINEIRAFADIKVMSIILEKRAAK